MVSALLNDIADMAGIGVSTSRMLVNLYTGKKNQMRINEMKLWIVMALPFGSVICYVCYQLFPFSFLFLLGFCC
jgi:hypothetical protein